MERYKVYNGRMHLPSSKPDHGFSDPEIDRDLERQKGTEKLKYSKREIIKSSKAETFQAVKK